jgi:predicted DNA-binding antitoxin AbrB/MazE fold protein
MSQELIHAVFENGAFRPLEPLPVSMNDGDAVGLRIEKLGQRTSLELATKVYDGLSPNEIDDIERIALDRSRFFGDRDIE